MAMHVNKAINEAKGALVSILAAQGVKAEGLRLEEVEKLDSGKWSVTLSFPSATDELPTFAQRIGIAAGRNYRVVTLDEFGEFESLKIRSFETV